MGAWSLQVLASGHSPGYLGWQRAVGHMVCCPKPHPERNWFVSKPETRSWEADCLWGRKEAAVQILIHIWKPQNPSPSPTRSLSSLLTCCCPGSGGHLSRDFLFLEYTSSRPYQSRVLGCLSLEYFPLRYSHGKALIPCTFPAYTRWALEVH